MPLIFFDGFDVYAGSPAFPMSLDRERQKILMLLRTRIYQQRRQEILDRYQARLAAKGVKGATNAH